MWPTVLGSISFILSGESAFDTLHSTYLLLALTLHAFYKRRLEFSQFLSAHSSLSMSRYVRLMMLAISEMICTVPVSIYNMYISTNGIPLQPWISWANTHYDFSYVGQVPAFVWMGNPNYWISVELTRWLFPASALLFFLLFGFGTEARRHYRSAFLRVAKFLRYESASDVPTHVSSQYVVSVSHFLALLSCSLTRRKPDFNKNISVGSLPVYIASQHVKPTSQFMPFVRQRVDIDVEKAAGCPSPSFINDDQQPSLTATCTGGDADESAVTAPSFPHFTDNDIDCHAVSGYQRPFSLPSICPAPLLILHGSRSMDSVLITVQTQYAAV